MTGGQSYFSDIRDIANTLNFTAGIEFQEFLELFGQHEAHSTVTFWGDPTVFFGVSRLLLGF